MHLRPWWKSPKFLYWVALFTISVVYVGVPWTRLMMIKVPNQVESNVVVGSYSAKSLYGYSGLPIAITQDSGAILILSCAAPDSKRGNATCFRNQESHNGTRVKVFWTEQPAGYLAGSVNRPSRIEAINGPTLFSETDALLHLDNQTKSWRAFIYIFVFGAITYFPLMLVLNRIAAMEENQKTNSSNV